MCSDGRRPKLEEDSRKELMVGSPVTVPASGYRKNRSASARIRGRLRAALAETNQRCSPESM